MTALLIAGRSKADKTHGAMVHVVHVVAVLLTSLDICTELDDGMLGRIKLLSSQYVTG